MIAASAQHFFIFALPIMNFHDLQIIDPILQAIQEKGYTSPTPIQEKAIPHVLRGKDLLGCAQTGTGKTAAFAIPILQLLSEARAKGNWFKGITALVLTPTRELAIQIDESFAAYGRHTKLRHTVIFGGIKQHTQVQRLRSGVDILIATPGRLLDLMQQGIISLQDLQLFVLDEADRMLDMGFIHDIKRIIAKLPAKRQSLFFSATMPPVITKLAETLLTNPARVEVTPVSSTAETVAQKMYFVEKKHKKSLLTHLLSDASIPSALVFTRTKHGANKLTQFIKKSGISAEAIHGSKSQNARQAALQSFKNKKTRVLVATDIAARGIDIDELSHVINFEIPNEPETYVHRIGRTGRAQNTGMALSFCDISEQPYLRDIHKLIKKDIPIEANHPYITEQANPLPKAPARSFNKGKPSRGRREPRARKGSERHH